MLRFAGFEDARAGYARWDAAGFHAFDGGAEAVEIQIIQRDAGGALV